MATCTPFNVHDHHKYGIFYQSFLNLSLEILLSLAYICTSWLQKYVYSMYTVCMYVYADRCWPTSSYPKNGKKERNELHICALETKQEGSP
jgi:hypothetical protein